MTSFDKYYEDRSNYDEININVIINNAIKYIKNIVKERKYLKLLINYFWKWQNKDKQQIYRTYYETLNTFNVKFDVNNLVENIDDDGQLSSVFNYINTLLAILSERKKIINELLKIYLINCRTDIMLEINLLKHDTEELQKKLDELPTITCTTSKCESLDCCYLVYKRRNTMPITSDTIQEINTTLKSINEQIKKK